MNCFSCKNNNCVMKKAENEKVTPCRLCKRAANMPEAVCWECIRTETACYFMERGGDETQQE